MISAVDDGTSPAISTVHQDIIQTHIFTRLDGPTLASAACASSHLHALSTDDSLWRQICNDTWPSTTDPRVRHVIDSLPSSHRSFYSHAFPALPTAIREEITDSSRLKETTSPSVFRKNGILPSIFEKFTDFTLSPPHIFSKKTALVPPLLPDLVSSELISAVDLKFMNIPILSRVVKTETGSDWFMSSPFRVDALDPKETVQTGVDGVHACLEESMSLSWVVIDPAQGRAADFSSAKPVQVTRHWLTGDLHVRFATVLKRGEGERVQCAAVVTCRGSETGEVQVREVSFVVEDMEGRSLSGEGSLVILRGAMGSGERRRRRDGEEERERYDEFMEMKRERRERKERKERRMDMVCVFTVVTLLVTWGSLLLKVSS